MFRLTSSLVLLAIFVVVGCNREASKTGGDAAKKKGGEGPAPAVSANGNDDHKGAADATHEITGDLTLLGKTKPVTMPATVAVKDDELTLTSEFKINRSDWGMTFGKGMVEDAVSLKLNIAAKK